MTRRDARTSYRNFPSAYADAFLAASTQDFVLGPFSSYTEARTAVRDLYRFRSFLRAAVEDEGDDDAYARHLHNTAKDVKLEVITTPNTDFAIRFSLNPIVRAMMATRQHNA